MGKTLNISDEERALLTDEELAGMEEGEDFDEGEDGEGEGEGEGEGSANTSAEAASADNDGEGEGSDGEGAGEGEGEGEGQGNTGAEAAAAAAASATSTDDGAAAAGDDAELAEFTTVQPLPVSKLPDDFDDKLKAIETGKADLGTKLDEGDITTAEYHAELDKLNRQERDLERVKDRHEVSEQQRYATWTGVHVQALFTRHPEYKANDMLTGLLDQEVRKLQATDKYASDTDPKILIDAHKKISAALPAAFASKPTAAAKDANKEAAKPVKKPSAPSLAKVPAAETDQPGEHEFSHLDALLDRDPQAYERALEKLARTDPAKYDAYLAQ